MKYAFVHATLAAACVLGAAGSASAQTVYTDRAAFLAATSNQVVTDFDDGANTVTGFFGVTYTNPNYSITANTGVLITSDPNAGGPTSYQYNSGDVLVFNSGASGTFTIDPNVRAFGFDVGTTAGTITINDVVYTPLGRPTFNFFGLVGSSSLDPITISFSNTGRGIIDNVRVASPTAATPSVPEPATWATVLLGFGMVGHAIRRRRMTNATVAA